jgi:hypothetical protein
VRHRTGKGKNTNGAPSGWERVRLRSARCSFPDPAGAQVILTEGFRVFPQSLDAKAGLVPRSGDDVVLPNSFLFIIYLLFYNSTLCCQRYWKRRKVSNKKFWEELIAYFPWYDTGHIENDASNNSFVACVLVTAVTFLPSRCLATIRGFFTQPLPSNDKGSLTDLLPINYRGIFTEPLRSNYKGTFTEPLVSTIRGDTQTQAHRQQRDLISLPCFFKIGK